MTLHEDTVHFITVRTSKSAFTCMPRCAHVLWTILKSGIDLQIVTPLSQPESRSGAKLILRSIKRRFYELL